MSIVDRINEKLNAAAPDVAAQVLAFLEALEARRAAEEQAANQPKSWDAIMGGLQNSQTFNGDPVAIQHKLRAEWEQ